LKKSDYSNSSEWFFGQKAAQLFLANPKNIQNNILNAYVLIVSIFSPYNRHLKITLRLCIINTFICSYLFRLNFIMILKG